MPKIANLRERRVRRASPRNAKGPDHMEPLLGSRRACQEPEVGDCPQLPGVLKEDLALISQLEAAILNRHLVGHAAGELGPGSRRNSVVFDGEGIGNNFIKGLRNEFSFPVYDRSIKRRIFAPNRSIRDWGSQDEPQINADQVDASGLSASIC